MKVKSTTRPLRSHLKAAVKLMFRRACEDIGVSLASVADNIDVAHGLVQRWADSDHDASLPVYALASASAVPESLYHRILADLEMLRSQQTDDLERSPEGAAGSLLMRAGAAIEEVSRALTTGEITSLAAPGVLRKIACLEDDCRKLRRSLSHLERAAS